MKTILVAMCALTIAVAALPAAAQYGAKPAKQEERVKFDPKRDAAKDIQMAVTKATKENKRILLDVGGEWCIWCKRMDEFFIAQKDIGAMLKKNFIVVKVNFSPENENKELLSKYPKITGYPHMFVLEKDGSFLHSQDTALLEEGSGYSREKMIAFLAKWTMPKK
jgi:thiol:disulfide interchange protein